MFVHNRIRILLLMVLLASLGLSGCSQPYSREMDHKMASLLNLPAEIQAAPVTVQQAYQFAVANPEVMSQIPCYCGCGPIGHTSNYDCFVAGQNEAGLLQFDNHALGCSICVDITQDAMRLMEDEQSPKEIRAYIDASYARYGPSNIP